MSSSKKKLRKRLHYSILQGVSSIFCGSFKIQMYINEQKFTSFSDSYNY